ncbi:peptidase C14, caspase catalytic subunit p20 [Beggiatoa sp. PS]|nr:peptidase C14, caspase catalytic subunit p20 [Beggiatoa sp. PS]
MTPFLIKILGEQKYLPALEFLVTKLDNENILVRESVIEALFKEPKKNTVEILIAKLLADEYFWDTSTNSLRKKSWLQLFTQRIASVLSPLKLPTLSFYQKRRLQNLGLKDYAVEALSKIKESHRREILNQVEKVWEEYLCQEYYKQKRAGKSIQILDNIQNSQIVDALIAQLTLITPQRKPSSSRRMNLLNYRLNSSNIFDKRPLLSNSTLIIHILGDIKNPIAVKPLMTLLEKCRLYPPGINAVIDFLISIGSQDAIEFLKLKYKKKLLRRPATSILGQIEYSPTVEELLRKDSYELSQADIEVLGNIGDLRAMEPLLECYYHHMWHDEYEKEWLPTIIKNLCKIGGLHTIDWLISKLNESIQSVIIRSIIEILGKIGDSRAIEPLMAKLNIMAKLDDEYAVRDIIQLKAAAIRALAKINKDSRLVDKLIALVDKLIVLLDNQNGDIVANAILALGFLKDPRAIEPLVTRWTVELEYYRQQHIPALISQAGKRSPQFLQTFIIHALGNLRDLQALEFLNRLAETEPFSVDAELIVRYIYYIKKPCALRPLTNLFDDRIFQWTLGD